MTQLFRTDLYSVYNIDDPAHWDEVFNDLDTPPCSYFPDRIRFDMVASYFRNTCKSVLIERGYIDKDYRDCYYNFLSRKFTNYPKENVRLHFFNDRIEKESDIWRLEEIENEKLKTSEGKTGFYLGNIALKPLCYGSPGGTFGYVGRTTINASRTEQTPFLGSFADYEVNFLGSRFKVKAFPFTGQDRDVSQCALASLWMIFRYYTEKYTNYREILPYEVSQLSVDYSEGRIIPAYRGIYLRNITEALANFGFEPLQYVKSAYEKSLFYRLLYYYIESGIPLIIIFPPVAGRDEGHAVTVFGHLEGIEHTPCQHHSVCDSLQIRNSCCYTKGYIINDDNHLPYKILLKKDVNAEDYDTRFVSEHYRIEDISAFVVPTHEKIFLPAEHVDDLARHILLDDSLGCNFKTLSKKQITADEKFVLRIFLTSSRSFKHFRLKHPIGCGLERLYIELPMPKFIWVAEISTQALFEQGKIFGEMIFDATSNKYDLFSFMYIHYPGILIRNDRQVIGYKGRLELRNLPVDENYTYELYSSNLRPGGQR